MRPSIANRLVRRMKRTSLQPSLWTWPRHLTKGEPNPDSRLLQPVISELSVQLRMSNDDFVHASVYALTQHDIVLKVPSHNDVPVGGQVVEVTVCCGDWKVVSSQKCILHWAGDINGSSVVAGFVLDSFGETVRQWIPAEARNDIRFPVFLPAEITVDDDYDVTGQIVDYSLNGVRLLTKEPIELEKDYTTTVKMQHSSVKLRLRPRWVFDAGTGHQIGCTIPPEQGALLACRFHAQSPVRPTPMHPRTMNWDGHVDTDDSEIPFGTELPLD
jgi:hypothetical protein